MEREPYYYSSIYYEKYGNEFDELERCTCSLGEDWDTYISMFDVFGDILFEYYQLRWEHGEDLKAFALMYHNVDIDRCSIVDKAYFVHKKNEIEGYRDKVFSSGISCKERVVKYYYDYDILFEMFFNKHTHCKMITKEATGIDCFTIEDYNSIKHEKHNHVYSINDLSEQMCADILMNISELETACFDESYIVEENQEILLAHKSTYYKTQYVKFKQMDTDDAIFNQSKLRRYGSIISYVNYMSNTKLREEQEQNIKRCLSLSFPDFFKWNGSIRMGLRNWTNYIKEIARIKEIKERKIREEEEKIWREKEEKRLEQYRFNVRNRHSRDNKISFREKEHIYLVDNTPLDSVTNFVKNCFPEFNADYHAARKAEALGITKEAVLEMWEEKGRESREKGTEMHKKIEDYYLGKNPSSDETFDLFRIFANKVTLKPYRTEWSIYDWKQKIAGTIDFIDYQNGVYTIYDWKRSDKLIAKNGLPIKNSLYGEKALPPIEHLDDSPYYHYALQLSLYKYILEKNYGLIVSKLRLGIFHPSYNKPYVLEIPYLKNEIDTLFNLKSEVIF